MTVMTEPTTDDVLSVPEVIELLGRKFRSAKDLTLERDMYIMSLMRAAKIADLFDRKDKPSVTFDLDELAEQIIVAAFESGKMFEITAAVLDEEGVKWTRSGSIKNAQWLSEITEKKSKDTIMQYIAVIILAFFMKGPAFSATLSESLTLVAKSQTANAGSETSEVPMNENEPSADVASPEAPSTSEIGANLSDTSLHMIPTDTKPSSSGP